MTIPGYGAPKDDPQQFADQDGILPATVLHIHRGNAGDPADAIPGPGAPLNVARHLLAELVDDDQVLLRRWRGDWWRYRGPHWSIAEPAGVRKWLYERLEHAKYEAKNKDGTWESRAWNPNKGKVDQILDAMAAPTLLPQEVQAPTWLHTGASGIGYVPCQNGLVNVSTRRLEPMTPRYFCTSSVPFDYDPNVGEPAKWLEFLRTIWPQVDGKDAAEVDTLQEWFGYVLSGRLDLQKMLLIVGPRRSGKGTIARILEALLGGEANVASPTLASLTGQFGMQPLIGKLLAIVGDARLQAHGQEQVVERLLSISGQDSLEVDRKNLTAWHGRLSTRFMILSNELPRFGDAAGAIASRFVILTMQESFLGREDTELERKLVAELPAILKWALDGLVRLNKQKRLTEPESSLAAASALADLVSPISVFLREVCDVDPEESVAVDTLYREYGEWCRENGRGVSSKQKLSSDLRTVMPQLTDYRPKLGGKTLPRHYKGITVSADWMEREKPLSWRMASSFNKDDQ